MDVEKPTRGNGRQLHGNLFRRRACECKVERSCLNATTAYEDSSRSNVVRDEGCDPRLLPPGHWNRKAREPDHVMVGWSSSGHHMMYGTLEAQHAIWWHQHPASCKAKKFLLYETSGRGNGIGSVLHKTTILLQAALDLDRILVLHPNPRGQWIDAPFCHGTNYTLDSCYFEPISSCSVHDALGGREWESIPWLDTFTYAENSERTLRDSCNEFGALFLIRSTPCIFHEMLRQGNLSTASYYWWRAQGVAYLVRPNARTLRELESRRVAIFENGSIAAGTLSVHIRHGDKIRESALAPDETYLAQAEAVLQKHPHSMKRSIFLSTEDAETVQFFSGLTNWTVRWTHVQRQRRDSVESTAQFANRLGWDEDFLNSLLSLQLALDCNAWVGMISSNWNRLVDELRSTIRCKYDRPYVDVFAGTNITDYDWR